MWGANAVNGAINIITKNAKNTQERLVTGRGGSAERALGGLKYGGSLGETTYYRVYGKYFKRDGFVNTPNIENADEWNLGHGGIRVGWNISERDSLTVQAGIIRGTLGQPYEIPAASYRSYRDGA